MPSHLQPRTRQDGSKVWVVLFPTSRATDGRQPRYISQTFEKKGEAQDYLAELRRRRKKGEVVEPSKLLLDEYLTEHWFPSTELRANTEENYRRFVRLYLSPTLGDLPLCDIEPLTIQDCYNGLTAKGLAPRTVRYAHSILRSALEAAVGWKMLNSNPADSVKLPKKEQQEVRYLDGPEVGAFLGAAWFEPDWVEVFFGLMLATGCRPSELQGLTWPAVDLDKAVVRIEQTLVTTSGGWHFGPPKTKKGRRSITIPTSTVEALRRHKRAQAEDRLKAGRCWHDLGLVFCNAAGLPIDRSNTVSRHFLPALRRAANALYPALTVKGDPDLEHKREEMLKVRLYGLRHSNITAMLAAGVSPKTVSERAGHSSTGFTLDVYGHCTDSMQQEAADRLEEAIYG